MVDESTTHTTSFVRRPEVMFTIVDDELIVMAEGHNDFFVSNAVGTTVWETLETPTTLEGLCDAVMARFDGATRADIRGDVVEFLAALEQRDLITSRATA